MDSIERLTSLGYNFNDAGQLRKLDNNNQCTDEPFQYKISEEKDECEANYEKLGEAVTGYLYNLLETQENLIRLPVPKEATSDRGSFIFATKDYDKKDKLMILIQGSGPVRAGMWARSLIINQDMDTGSQIPYIRRAVKMGCGVMVLNPNVNSLPNEQLGHDRKPEEHGQYVWESYVMNTLASSILIVAHSYGGVITVMLPLVHNIRKDFETRVKAVAFSDSVHGIFNLKIRNHLKKVSRNWVVSDAPLDTPVKSFSKDITLVSAGTMAHEMTSHSALESIFKFFDERLKVPDDEKSKASLFKRLTSSLSLT